MSTQPRSHERGAFTLVDLLIVVLCVGLFLALVFPALATTRADVLRVRCADNLKRVGCAFHIWADSHQGRYPMAVTTRDGGTAMNIGNALATYSHYMVLSNELKTTSVVICPLDQRAPRTNFLGNTSPIGDFRFNTAVSYFVGRDATEANPRMFLAGDRNIFGPTTANTGYGNSTPNAYVSIDTGAGAIVALGTNIAANAVKPGWTARMHEQEGNVLQTDGHVESCDSTQLRALLRQTRDGGSVPGPNVILFP